MENSQNFILAEKMNQILILNVLISNIFCSNNSSFIKANGSYYINLTSNQIISNKFLDSFFINSCEGLIVINQTNISLNTITSSTFSIYCFFMGNFQFFLNNSIIEANIFSNSTLVQLKILNSIDIILISSSTFRFNQNLQRGTLFFDIKGSVLFLKILNIYFFQNSAIDNLISIKNIFSETIIDNVIFENNIASQILYIFEGGNISIFSLNCLMNNQRFFDSQTILIGITPTPGPCFVFQEFVKILIQQVEISNGFAISNIVGIVIIQSFELGKNYLIFFILYFFYIKLVCPNYITSFQCLKNNVKNNNSYINFVGNCLFFDSHSPIYIEDSSFINNSIMIKPNSMNGGNPCINSIIFYSSLFIRNSTFKYNQAFEQSNCIRFIGSSFEIIDSVFKGMSYSSNDPYIGNTGSLIIASDVTNLVNVSFIGNKANKAAGILFQNMKNNKQIIYCEMVHKIHFLLFTNN